MSFSTQNNKILYNNTPITIKGVNWFGLETEVYCLHGLWAATFDSFITFILKNKFNAIRVPISLEAMLNLDSIKIKSVDLSINPKFKDFTVGQFLDYFVSYCASKGILVMFDFHRFVGTGTITELWYSADYPESQLIKGWSNIVNRFMKFPNVFAIDLKNEPHGQATWATGDSQTDWKSAAERIGNAILKINPKLLIFVEGVESYKGQGSWWGGNLIGVNDNKVNLSVPNRLVYSPHVYGPSVFAQPYFTDSSFSNMPPIWDRDFGFVSKNNIAPIVIGEFGGWLKSSNHDDAWQAKITSYISANNLSFFYWCLQPNSGDTGGLLNDDWVTPVQAKLDLLSQASPNPTKFNPFTGGAPTPGPVDPVPVPSKVDYKDKFIKLYNKIHNTSSGYFNSEGIPYHSVETLMAEAPDHGHETTSEALSYYIWLEVEYGRLTKDWSGLQKAWNILETLTIPTDQEQPSNSGYNSNSPATYASEHNEIEKYPSTLQPEVPVGNDPIYSDITQKHGNRVYGMHWLKDCDNWYGFGDTPNKSVYFNTFQRGPHESVFKTVPQPSIELLKYGGPNGFLDLFSLSKNGSYSAQYKYTNAPDADARAIEAIYWAKKFADKQGGSNIVNDIVKKASVMGDWLRYSMFDKYFKPIGCQDINAKGNDYNSAHYLMSWYYAWGGPVTPQGWSWKIGCSHSHSGYQNPLAAYALSQVSDFTSNMSQNGPNDWKKSFNRQLQMYHWLQSAEGPIAGGVTNSFNGSYDKYPTNLPTFFDMVYDEQPVYLEPPSNNWYGFQCWTMERVAQYYYATQDKKVEKLLKKWCSWSNANVIFKNNKASIPASLKWSGAPDSSFKDDNSMPPANKNLHVKVTSYNNDIGIIGALSRIFNYYGSVSKNKTLLKNASKLIDYILTTEDSLGYSIAEERPDYINKSGNSYTTGFDTPVYIPSNWSGKMPNGDVINSNSTFISIRSKYKNDPQWSKIEMAKSTGKAPSFNYHRFWGQVEIARSIALMEYISTNNVPTPGPVDPVPNPVPTPGPVNPVPNPGPNQQNVTITVVQTGSWQSSGKTYYQVDILIKNNSSQVINDLTFNIKADGVDSFWNCDKSGNGYHFPSWMKNSGGLKGNETLNAGAIVYNSLPVVTIDGQPAPGPVDPVPNPGPVDPVPTPGNNPLVTKNASSSAIRAYNAIKDFKGKKMLSGIYDKNEFEFIKDQIGSYPAIFGIDFMRYSLGYTQFDGFPDANEISDYIKYVKDNNLLLTASWHHSPGVPEVNKENYWKGFYLNFPFQNYYDQLKKEWAYIASLLKKFKDADIPVLWRPYHEVSNSAWFWWGFQGANNFKDLYRKMFDEFVNVHGLTNLIWVWCPNHSYDNSQNSWYPGDDVVDVVAIDYPETWRYNECVKTAPNKLIALGEISMKDGYNHISKFNEAPWSYMMSWPREQGAIQAGGQVTKDVFGGNLIANAPFKY